MKNIFVHLSATLLTMALFDAGAIAQPQFRRPEQGAQFVFYDAVNHFPADSSRARIVVHYRIDENFFIATRNSDTSFPHEFRRRGEISVELLDSVAGSIARELDNVLIGAPSTETPAGPKRWYQGFFSFEVRPGIYKILFEVTDLESKRNFVDNSRRLFAGNASSEPLAVSTPLFIERPDTAGATERFVPQNFGDDMLFGEPSALLLQIASNEILNDPVTVSYLITSQPQSTGESSEISIRDSVTLPLLRDHALVPRKDRERIAYDYSGRKTAAPPFVVLPFPGEKLPLRTYRMSLTIKRGSQRKEISKEFRAVWPDMPLSLKDVDYALEVMRYITTENQLDSLKSGNYEDRRRHLEEYWKLRDRTPETAYNEVMTEYYRRVDHAMRAFGTLRVPDGARSDRGRIYILHGPPSRTERTLNPSGLYEEVWVYEQFKKRFTFVDNSRNGVYELIPATPQ